MEVNTIVSHYVALLRNFSKYMNSK